MIKGRTSSGFEFEVDEHKIRSERFQIILTELYNVTKSDEDDTEKDIKAMSAVERYERFILGDKQHEKLVDYCDSIAESGYATSEDVQKEVNEILEIVSNNDKQSKN